MFKFSAQLDEVRDYAKHVIEKRDNMKVKYIVDRDDVMTDELEKDVEEKLRKWRLKERKHEFHERIQQLNIKEMLPKQHIQNKLKQLDQYSTLLAEKEGDREVEEKLGVKLDNNKYHTIQHYADPLPGEELPKEKSYYEKKRERMEEEGKTQQEIEELMNKLHEEKKARKERKRKERIEKLAEQKRLEELRSKKKQDKEHKEIEEKRKKISDTIHKIKEDRQQSISQMLEETRKVQKNPLYRQIEQKFHEDEESEIEKRKRHLQSLRDLRQPLNREEILEHGKKMDDIVKEKQEERKKSRIALVTHSYDYSKYHTKFLDNIMEQEAAQQEEKERKDEERQRVQEQRDIYDKYVKEMHWPKISEKKKAELETLKMSMKTSPKNPKSIIGQGNHDTASRNNQNRAASAHRQNEEDSTMRRQVVWAENTMKPKPKEKKEGKIVDWLREQRTKHDLDIQNGVSPQHNKTNDWKKELDKMQLHGKEKYDMFLGKAKDFEEKAKRKQQIIGTTKGATIEDIIELNDMYVESIKAKLELLHDLGDKR
eukprot:403335841